MGEPKLVQTEYAMPISEDRFTTLVKPRHEQFAYWRHLIGPIAEVEPVEARSRPGFAATARGQDLGQMHIGSLRSDGMSYRRTPELIRKSSIDHWQLTLRVRGTEFTSSSGHMLRSRPGSLDLRSLARPSVGTVTAGEAICVFLRRDNFPHLAGTLDAACHMPIKGGMKNILCEFLFALDRHRPSLTTQDVPIVVSSLTALLGTFANPSRDRTASSAMPIAASQLELAKRYIDNNLVSPELNPTALCRALGISRRKLYYLFSSSGGVNKFIRERRLTACHTALSNAADPRRISTIAYDYGFKDAAQFSKLFRTYYGYCPKDVRELHLSGYIPHQECPSSFVQWLLQVRGSGEH